MASDARWDGLESPFTREAPRVADRERELPFEPEGPFLTTALAENQGFEAPAAQRHDGPGATALWEAYARGAQEFEQETPAPVKAIGKASPVAKACETLDHFSLDQHALTPAHQAKVTEIAQRIVSSQTTSQRIRSVRFVGHADPSGTVEHNQDLGWERASAVGFALVEALRVFHLGIDSQLDFDVQSMGEAHPVSSTDMGLNRRVEVCLLTTPITGTRIGNGSHWFAQGGTPAMQPVRTGNEIRPLIGGGNTFAEMVRAIRTAKSREHYIYLLGWWLSDGFPLIRGDAHSTIRQLFADASALEVEVRAMLWDQKQPPQQNTAEVDNINALANGAAILDDRTLWAGTHHSKVLVVKGEDGLIAFCGGVDINVDRIGYAKGVPAQDGYPMHDVHCRVQGPAACDLLRVFVERWEDHPAHVALDATKSKGSGLRGVPDQNRVNDGAVRRPANMTAQIGRTYGNGARHAGVPGGYRFAPNGELTALRMILRGIQQARKFIYIEDQYLVSSDISTALVAALPNIQHLIILIPDSALTTSLGTQQWYRRHQFLAPLLASSGAAKARVFILSPPGTPGTYVHSKLMVVDDEFATIGSANLCRRSLTHDSETIVGFYDPSPASWIHSLRVQLWAKHLGMDSPSGRLALVNPIIGARYWRAPPPGAHVAPYNDQTNVAPLAPALDVEWNTLIDPDGA